MPIIQNRRHFIAGLAAGTAGLVAAPRLALAEPAPETTSVRLGRWVGGAYCWESLYLAGELLRADGMTDVQYVQGDQKYFDSSEWIAAGEIDFDFNMPTMHIRGVEAGVPLKILAGVHSGCWELRANDRINSIADLKGKRMGVWAMNDHPQVFLQLLINYVGLDPNRDVEWVVGVQKNGSLMQNFIDGKVDAFLVDTSQYSEVRAKNIGHTVFANLVDRPWSQYFCCMVAGRSAYVDKYPVATKRVLRAILRSAEFCAANPTAAARAVVDRGFLPSYDVALTTLQNTGQDKWGEYDAEDSVRFYALRMLETGMIKSSPQEIIAKGTDFRFSDEIKRELKA
jgi:NitT/TauT family transport system substrate-binding protein